MDASMILNLIKCLALNYPIISDWGYTFQKVIKLIVPPGYVPQVLNYLRTPSSKVLDIHDNHTAIQKIIDDANSGIVFVVSRASEKCRRLLFDLGDYAKGGTNAVFLYITDDELNLLEGEFFEIPLEDPINFSETVEKIVPKPEELSAVKSQVCHLRIEDATACGMALLVAACFLNPGVGGRQEDERMLTYMDVCQQLMDWNDAATDHAELEISFLKCLYQYQLEGNIQAVKLPNVESDKLENRHSCIFYDDSYLYLSDVFLHRVAEPLLELESPVKLKKALAESGMLKSDHAGYTCKMRYCTAYGKSESIRMLRFIKEKVILPGKLRFIDLCIGGSSNEN